jgi:hypothetical protein
MSNDQFQNSRLAEATRGYPARPSRETQSQIVYTGTREYRNEVTESDSDPI